MYVIIFSVAFIENIFPPAPSDVLVVFGGALAAMEKGHFLAAFIAGTAGSTLGFITMYGVGKWFGRKIIETGKIKFIKLETLHKFEKWFTKYGFWLIVGNRFLTGTRAVISFFAGMSELDFKRTTMLSFIGSSLWYSILVYAGYSLGSNWERISYYLKTYSIVITALVVLSIFVAIVRLLFKKRIKST
jgi:membrane protein DedA with SNARE-associated domain